MIDGKEARLQVIGHRMIDRISHLAHGHTARRNHRLSDKYTALGHGSHSELSNLSFDNSFWPKLGKTGAISPPWWVHTHRVGKHSIPKFLLIEISERIKFLGALFSAKSRFIVHRCSLFIPQLVTT
jgi:hypothetical protein